MSEYQYYEFYSVDRELTHKEREEIDRLSTRFSPTSRRAVFSYSYSNFRHDEESILLKYFDFFLYLSNWGSKRIIYKFPQELVDYQVIKRYVCNIDYDYGDNEIKIYKKSKYILVDIHFSDEEGDAWIEDENYISSDLIGIREDILQGDYRALFIIWLHIKKVGFQMGQIDESMKIPKQIIPNNLGKLNSKLESLMRLYEVDGDWIKGASNYSCSSKTKEMDYEKLIRKLPIEKKDEYLMKILSGESNLKITLKKEIDQINGVGERKEAGNITLKELLRSTKNEEVNRIKFEEGQAENVRINKLNDLEKNKKVILREIDYHIERGSGKSYDEALKRIVNLRDLALYKNGEIEFKIWINTIKKRVAKRPAMFKRIESKGL